MGVEAELRMGARGTSCPQTAPCFSHDSAAWTKATLTLFTGREHQLWIDVLLAASLWDPWNAYVCWSTFQEKSLLR